MRAPRTIGAPVPESVVELWTRALLLIDEHTRRVRTTQRTPECLRPHAHGPLRRVQCEAFVQSVRAVVAAPGAPTVDPAKATHSLRRGRVFLNGALTALAVVNITSPCPHRARTGVAELVHVAARISHAVHKAPNRRELTALLRHVGPWPLSLARVVSI
jgi:hypothetical protein